MRFDDSGTPPGQLSLRQVHLLLAGFVLFALLSGFLTFDWSWRMPFPLREWLFAAHRTAGFCAGVCGIIWLIRFRFPQRRKQAPDRHHVAILLFQFSLVVLAMVIASAAWIGRALAGRWVELISPLPSFNLVSRPDSSLAHTLLTAHGALAKVMLATVLIHAASAALHWLREKIHDGAGSR